MNLRQPNFLYKQNCPCWTIFVLAEETKLEIQCTLKPKNLLSYPLIFSVPAKFSPKLKSKPNISYIFFRNKPSSNGV